MHAHDDAVARPASTRGVDRIAEEDRRRAAPHGHGIGTGTRALIWHTPHCSTSRNALALLRHAGIAPEVVEYLRDPPTRAQLRAMIEAAGIGVRAALRSKEAAFAARGLDDPALDDDALLDAMLAEPVLIERPFVRTDLGTRLVRPLETLLQILPPLQAPFVKENGQLLAG